MNILHTETLKKWGGQQNRVLAEAVGLSAKGHKVIIACNRDSFLAHRARNAAIKVYELNMSKEAYPSMIRRLMVIMKEEAVEIVSTHSSVDSWSGGIAAKLTGRRLVRFRHNLYPIGKGPLAKFIYSIPDRITTVSGAVRDLLIERGVRKEKLTVIPDAVDPLTYNPLADDLREELKIPPDALVVGNTSTFTEVKGQEYLLQAFNRISKRIPCILLFAGRLVEPSRSRYLSHVLPEFRERVIFLGHRDDIPRVLKTIDVFVYPSFLEGLGTALLEAMMMGKPLAVSDIPTFRDFINDGVNGLYFRKKDAEDIAEKVVTITQDKKLMERIGKNARETALARFTLEKMVDLTEAMYREVLDAA